MRTARLFEKYYYADPLFKDGHIQFHELCESLIPRGSEILEIGAGPSSPYNTTSPFLATLGRVTGVDISDEVSQNQSLVASHTFDGKTLPFAANTFDGCVSNYVLEHVEFPAAHFQEVARVLKPGGVYTFRTPNLHHYVAMSSWMLPHWVHLLIANRLRGMEADGHDPYPTFYRANTRRTINRLCAAAQLQVVSVAAIELPPWYGRRHQALFYPMMVYERVVNSSSYWEEFRVNLLGAVRKP